MQILVLLLVSLFQRLQMLQLVNEAGQLALKSVHFALTFTNALLLLLHFVLFLVNRPVEFLCSIQGFRCLKFEGAHIS